MLGVTGPKKIVKTVVTVIAVMIGLLSIAAGAAKIALVPEEAEFLGQFGFTTAMTVSFGIVQTLGGLSLLVPVTRLFGSLIAAAGFALSAFLILASGNAIFAGVSLVPLILAGFIGYRSFLGRLSTGHKGDDA